MSFNILTAAVSVLNIVFIIGIIALGVLATLCMIKYLRSN